MNKFIYALSECKCQTQNCNGFVCLYTEGSVFARDDIPVGLSQRILKCVNEIRKRVLQDTHLVPMRL